MKKILLPAIVIFSFCGFSATSQTNAIAQSTQIKNTSTHIEKCGILEHEQYLQQLDPSRAAQRAALEQDVQAYMSAHPGASPDRSVITIPVVVHLVYKTAAQNISDQQIQSQITVLNQDWTRTNPDASYTPAAFATVAANIGFNFCLATVDPSGLSTTGIERRNTTVTSFSSNDAVKHYANGGLNVWDPSNYLNIWVCNMGGGLLGYGEFPTTSLSQTFGVVIQYNCFGSQNIYPAGTYDPLYNLGRTTTHEFSHCFNLYHIWGDDGGSCSGTDGCADTPNQADATYGSPTGVQTDACATSAPGYMYENYMDYSDDVVMNLFTNNQKTRILYILTHNPYMSLQVSNRCGTVGIAKNYFKEGFDVHPSPSNGAFTLDFGSVVQENIDISIFNTLGEIIYTHHYDALNETELHLDLEGNPAGIYFVEVRTPTGRNTKKIILE